MLDLKVAFAQILVGFGIMLFDISLVVDESKCRLL